MMAKSRSVAVLGLLLLSCSIVRGQETCSYFTAIPKEERPDYEIEDFTGVTWSERPLLPPPDREDLCVGEYVAAATFGTQLIYIDEEIEGDVIIAKLNYEGTAEPYIGTFLMGRRHLLNAEIRREASLDNAWYLVVTESQDYETAEMRIYMFEVRVEDETFVARVSLEVVNIDDNAPVIHFFDTCSVEESGVARLTDCTYEVTDVDGEISTRFMTFNITSDRGDDTVFSIYPQNIAGDWYTMTITLQLNEPLDYETSALHIFSVTAFDSLPNTHTVSMMVQVENVESRAPRWVEVWAVQQFDEKTSQNFTVRAIDGDTGINKPIYYMLANNEEYPFFWIETVGDGYGGGIFYVSPIDRDTLQQEVFQLSIIAYKYVGDGNTTFTTEASIVIIVNDVNDQYPEPLQDDYWITIPEETAMTLSFDDEFGFYDRDLGEHAQYQVRLEDIYPPGAASAFYIAPEVGYQRQVFTMGTINHTMLDYEVPEFQVITLRVVAQDLHTPSHVGNATIHINLTNWNDEEPIFPTVESVGFNETEGAGYFVGTVLATDRDIGDRVVHTIMGNAGDYLTIDEETGDIFVSVDEAFDYHRQNEIIVQIRAEDTLGEPYHTATTQLVIQLYDINNTPPTLRLPRGSPQVEENVPDGYIISEGITATDPDTTALLHFEIDWEASYATKQGRETDPVEFHGCVEILTVYENENATGSATGVVVVREIRPGVTIDFEEFEVLYLAVRVTDNNTVLNDPSDELTFTVIIVDMNDNAPVWAEGSLEAELRVREVSASGTVVGSVLATDIDGPLYNQVRYTIVPREDTPDGLVKIDFYSGQIDVNITGAIDADVPPREYLYYTVIASDQCYEEDPDDCPPDPTYWETPGNISIYIIDTNNKYPETSYNESETTVYLYENATHLEPVVQLYSTDLDRDEIYHTVRYQINYQVNSRIRDFFSVDLDTGLVYVDYTTSDVLDRDGDEPQHRIFLTLYDNFYSEGDGNRNQEDLEILVVLLDVNDNAPELPTRESLSWSVLENLEVGTRILPEIYAPDRDEPDTDNSRVAYEILSLTSDRGLDVPELFVMININNVTGELESNLPLVGYWGTYDIHIRAYDHGIPQQSSNETYELVVRPYNYHAPEFTFPTDGDTIRLARESAALYTQLTLLSGETLPTLAATDPDGLQAGEVSFHVSGDEEAMQYFVVMNEVDNVGTLLLSQGFTEQVKEFQLTITATDGGTEPQALSTSVTVTMVFVPTLADPAFSETTTTVAFVEQEVGLTESYQLPLADDPKNYKCDDDCHDIYYHIYGGNDAGHFVLESTTNVLSLSTALDRSEADVHTLIIVAGNSPSFTGTPTSILTVTVNVREADPRPIFVSELYTAGISTLDSISRELLTVQATHSENATLTYTIDLSSMSVDSSLEAVKESAFILNPQSGVLTLNIQPTAAMQGMFEFQAVATDPAGESGRTEVRVYLISSLNRVYFLFYNTIEHVENNRDFIASTFSSGFNMTCHIDQVLPYTDSSGAALSDVTEVRSHFIRDDLPVDAEYIESLRSDTFLLRNIQLVLYTEELQLQDFVTDVSPVATTTESKLVAALAALSAILCVLCAVLLLLYAIRTRSLNRRLEALSTTKFGSQSSGLNTAGVSVPGTNKHAAAGSNPIWNEQIRAPDFDALSDVSGDSDLIGIENLPQFQFGEYTPAHNVDAMFDDNAAFPKNAVSSHNNSFGFPNTSPFSKNFANRDFSSS